MFPVMAPILKRHDSAQAGWPPAARKQVFVPHAGTRTKLACQRANRSIRDRHYAVTAGADVGAGANSSSRALSVRGCGRPTNVSRIRPPRNSITVGTPVMS